MEENPNLKCGFYRVAALCTAVKLGMCKLNHRKPGTACRRSGEVCGELLGYVTLRAEKAPRVPSAIWGRKARDTVQRHELESQRHKF